MKLFDYITEKTAFYVNNIKKPSAFVSYVGNRQFIRKFSLINLIMLPLVPFISSFFPFVAHSYIYVIEIFSLLFLGHPFLRYFVYCHEKLEKYKKECEEISVSWLDKDPFIQKTYDKLSLLYEISDYEEKLNVHSFDYEELHYLEADIEKLNSDNYEINLNLGKCNFKALVDEKNEEVKKLWQQYEDVPIEKLKEMLLGYKNKYYVECLKHHEKEIKEKLNIAQKNLFLTHTKTLSL
jgi:hypothetical protein